MLTYSNLKYYEVDYFSINDIEKTRIDSGIVKNGWYISIDNWPADCYYIQYYFRISKENIENIIKNYQGELVDTYVLKNKKITRICFNTAENAKTALEELKLLSILKN